MKQHEQKIQIAISQYIKTQYPDVIFTSESSGLRLSIAQAVILKKCRSCRALPDLWILEAKRGYHACLIELKKENAKIYKKNGELKKDKHLAEQEEIQHRLSQKGYFCQFAVGFDEAKQIVDYYLGG